MKVQRVEIDYDTGVVTVDTDLGEEMGREFQFPLAEGDGFRPPAQELAIEARDAVLARVREWLIRAEEDGRSERQSPGDHSEARIGS